MHTSDNQILYSFSGFTAIGSEYDVTSILQPAASIKVAVWNSFAVDI